MNIIYLGEVYEEVHNETWLNRERNAVISKGKYNRFYLREAGVESYPVLLDKSEILFR